jgi:glycogen(starch) synthase
VVNAHFALYGLPLLPYLRHGLPLVVHFHGPWAAEGAAEGAPPLVTWVKAWLERLVYRRGVRFIVLSKAFAKILVDTYGVDSSLVRIIPIGIDTEFFKPAADRSALRVPLGWAPHHFTVFTARRLVRRVGLLELVQAAARVRLAGTDMQIYIAGRGPMEAELRTRIAQLCMADRVHLLGFVSDDDLRDLYAAADFSILPSQVLEGFGSSIAESLACGTPVGVTPVGGMRDAVVDLEPALVAPSSTPEGIAALLLAAAGGRFVALDSMVCRTYAVQRFAWRAIALAIKDVFAEVLPSGQASSEAETIDHPERNRV